VIAPSILLTLPSRPGAVDERLEGRLSAGHERRQIDNALSKRKAGGWLEVEG
jgi:hypothetical protein